MSKKYDIKVSKNNDGTYDVFEQRNEKSNYSSSDLYRLKKHTEVHIEKLDTQIEQIKEQKETSRQILKSLEPHIKQIEKEREKENKEMIEQSKKTGKPQVRDE